MTGSKRIWCLAVLALLAVSCATEVGGAPAPMGMTSTRSSAAPETRSTLSSSGPASSPRPRDLPLAHVAPCDLVTVVQQRQLGIEQAGTPDDNPFVGPMCSYSSQAQKAGFALSISTTMGIEQFQAGFEHGDVRPLSIEGFPALELFTPVGDDLDHFCVVVVDVATGQVVHVNYIEEGLRNHLSRDVLCQRASQVAQFAVTNLLARG